MNCHAVFRRLWRCSKGAVALEAAGAVFILVLFAVGIVRVGLIAIDHNRLALATRSAIDLAVRLDIEGDPKTADVRRIATAVSEVAKIPSDQPHRLSISAFVPNGTGGASLSWNGKAGFGLGFSGVLAAPVPGGVLVNGDVFPVEAGQRLIVVEYMKIVNGKTRNSTAITYR